MIWPFGIEKRGGVLASETKDSTILKNSEREREREREEKEQ